MSENFIVTIHPGMNLTAGATLQNHKYVIQKLLRQSDLGVTYEAQHAFLGQIIALQTFNDAVRQRGDFDQLRQQFLSQVRAIVQQPKAHLPRVLDCFEEADMPFVVLEIVPDQPLPLLTDWLPVGVDEPIHPTRLTPSEAEVLAFTASSRAELADPLLGHPQKTGSAGANRAIGASAEETQPPTLGYSAGLDTRHRNPHPLVTQAQSFTVPASAFSTQTGFDTQVVQHPTSARPRSKAWMPLSLIFLSMMGGILGAGYGLSLRLSPAQSNAAATKEPSDSLTSKPRLFSREQSFPSDTDWPISETPEYSSDPTPFEEPVYRVPAIESYAQPELPPWPDETGYQDPVSPSSPQPTLGTATPALPDAQSAPLPDALTEAPPAPLPTTPPQISAPPPPLAPAPFEPSLPQFSEPSEPAPPAAEPAPPLLPPTDPAVIQQ